MWLVAASANPLRHETRIVGDHVVAPQRIVVDGVASSGYHVPDDHPTAADTRAVAPRLPGLRLVEDAEVRVVDVTPAAPAPVVAEVNDRAQRDALYAMAISRGWSGEDLDGTWDGTPATDPAERSPRTGLTLLEHVQTRPPRDWAAVQAIGQAPWASTDWVDPSSGWVPPAWTSRVREPESATTTDEQPTEVWDSVSQDAPTVVVDDPAVVLDEGVTTDAEWAYPAEQVERASDIVAALVAKFGAANVKRGRVNSELRKSGLHQLASDPQLSWFLSRLTDPLT